MAREKQTIRDIKLNTEKNNSRALTLLQPTEDVTITTKDKFVILPGPKGEGWILQVWSPVQNG